MRTAQAHRLRDAIEAEFDNADVLIHVEPEESVPPAASGHTVPGRLTAQVRFTAAARPTATG